MLVLNRKVSNNNVESCWLQGYADADLGWDRVPPLGWNQAEKMAWLQGYDSFGEQEVKNAA
jgi:hypothetical protein